MMISKLQYISQGEGIAQHLQNIQKVCDWGCDWIQLRLKNVSDREYIQAGIKARKICGQNGARLIINDKVKVAAEVDADGVHVGKKDAAPSSARASLGRDKLVGGTANTYEDVIDLVAQGVDYIGLGPYRFTRTKTPLSPVLGLEGYADILKRLAQGQIDIPVIAIGGIVMDDIKAIRSTGVHGIAVSGWLSTNSLLTLDHQKIYALLQ